MDKIVELSQVNKLLRGQFAVPKLDYIDTTPELNRRNYTIRAIVTNLINQGYEDIIADVLPKNYAKLEDQILMEELEESILNKINNRNPVMTDTELSTIFHAIQIWGGNTARAFYFKENGGVENNFRVEAYRKAIDSILSGEIENAIGYFNELNKINIAFASKHFSFWTRSIQNSDNNGPRQLPILDSLTFKITYGKPTPNYRLYEHYLFNMYEVSAQIGITIHSLERQLFNFADTEKGKEWISQRLR